MQRSERPRHEKLPCFVYIDECYDVIREDENIADIIDQCRSQNIGLILAHQRTNQIVSKNVLDALMNSALRCHQAGPRTGDRRKNALLNVGVAFHGRHDVGNQVRPSLQVHINLGERSLYVLILGDHLILRTDIAAAAQYENQDKKTCNTKHNP